MSGPLEPMGTLTGIQVRSALLAATSAPSLHNSQPWRFACTPFAFELHSDLRRELRAADPDHREIVLACGAALVNLRLAVRALGVAVDVRLMPDPARPTLLAVVRPEGRLVPSSNDKELAGAIFRRHTNRRPFLAEPVAGGVVGKLGQAARTEQGWFAVVPTEKQPALRTMLAAAHRSQLADPEFVAEWRRWTGGNSAGPGGVPISSGGIQPEQQDLWVMRDVAGGQGQQRSAGKDFESDALIAVIGSLDDSPLAQLKAGQAMERVLLSATVEGLSASFLSQVVDVPETRRQLRELLGGGLWPQTVLRLGYGSPVPASPRRPVSEVVPQSPDLEGSPVS